MHPEEMWNSMKDDAEAGGENGKDKGKEGTEKPKEEAKVEEVPQEIQTRDETEAIIDRELAEYAKLAHIDPYAPNKPKLPPEKQKIMDQDIEFIKDKIAKEPNFNDF